MARRADRISRRFPVGSPVYYFTGSLQEQPLVGHIRAAFSVCCDTIVGWVQEHPDCIAATHIAVIPKVKKSEEEVLS